MPQKILVVDDESLVVDITKKKLEQQGFTAIGACDGEAAMEILKEGLVDLIVMDVEMPRMNGYEFLSERKKVPGGESIPVIMLTAYNTVEPIFRRKGVKDFLLKPVRFQDLLSCVLKVLSERVKAEEAARDHQE